MPSVEIVSPFAGRILQHLLYQGNRNDCAPFTAATLIHALTDQRIDPSELAQQMNHLVWRRGMPVVRRIPNWATFPWGIADVLREYGIAARWQLFLPVQELIDNLSTPVIYLPIILSWKPLWAHVMTLVAYHPKRGFGFANTQSPHKEIDWLKGDRFLRLWKAAFHCTIIVAPDGEASLLTGN